MIQSLSKVPKGTYARGVVLITLTYPGAYPSDPHEWKRQLDNFLRALLREQEGLSVYWKLEPQMRGAPHFHLLVLNTRHVPKQWVAETWYRVVGSGDERHLKAGTRVEAPKRGDACAKYASKYAGKVADTEDKEWAWPGRWWGIRGRDNLGIDVETRDVGPWLYERLHWAITLRKRQSWHEKTNCCAWVCPLPDPPLDSGGWWRISDEDVRELLGDGWERWEDPDADLD